MSGLIAAIATGTAAVAGSISSFSQVARQNKKMRLAEAEADRAMKEARKRLDVNVYEALSIQKEPYELAREAAMVAGTQGLQAGMEGETRGAAATAGRVAMAQAAEQAKIRSAMGQELQGIQQQIVNEEGRLKDIGMGLDLQEAAGAQQAAADAEKARAAALQQGFEGLVQAGTTAMSMAPLYSDAGIGFGNARGLENMPSNIGREARSLGMTRKEYIDLNRLNQLNLQQAEANNAFKINESIFNNTDFSGVGGFQRPRSGPLTPEELAILRRQQHLLIKPGLE